MAWDSSKPAAGSPRLSSELRQNFQAIERAIFQNLAANTLHLGWLASYADGFGAPTGGATVTQAGPGLGDTKEFGLGGYAAKVTAAGSSGRWGQVVYPALPTAFQGRSFSLAVFARASGLNKARLYVYDGLSYQYSDYISDSVDTWTTLVAATGLTATTLEFGVEVAAGANVYVEGWTLLQGQIASQRWIPEEGRSLKTLLQGFAYSSGQGNAGGGGDTELTSFGTPLGANYLGQPGDMLMISATFSLAADGNSKVAKFGIGAATPITIVSTTANVSPHVVPVLLFLRRRTSSTASLTGIAWQGAAPGGAPTPYLVNGAFSGIDFTAKQTLKVFAASTNANAVKLTDCDYVRACGLAGVTV